MQDEIDMFPQIKKQYIIEENYFHTATINEYKSKQTQFMIIQE